VVCLVSEVNKVRNQDQPALGDKSKNWTLQGKDCILTSEGRTKGEHGPGIGGHYERQLCHFGHKRKKSKTWGRGLPSGRKKKKQEWFVKKALNAIKIGRVK